MVTIHPANAEDFSSLGYGALEPAELEIEERAGGMYELRMVHPMDERGKWWNIAKYRIIKAPAPVRETPLVEMGHTTTTVVRKVYRVKVNTRLRLRTAPSTSTGKIIGRYKNGTRVIQTGVSGDWYQVIVQEGGATGWMHSSYLQYVKDLTETVVGDAPGTVIQPRQTREQLFRIVSVERDDDAGMVTVTAQHIFYDLAGNIVKNEYSPEDADAAEVCAQLMARALNPHSFRLYCAAEGKVSGEYAGKSIVSALLEKEIGVVTQTGARLIRDNFDVFLLADEVRDRGVSIRHGKNLLGAVLTEDVSGVVTRIVPVGKDKDGNPLYLDGDGYVDSPRAAEIPVIRAKWMEYDVSVVEKAADADASEDKYATVAEAQARLRALAEAEFEAGIDAPTVGLEVDFVPLENTVQYAQYADLQSVHLYDTVHVYAPRSGINAAVRMTGYVWDGMANGGKGRYKSVTLGQLQELETTVYGYDIAADTVSGTKVIDGSVGGSKLRNASIEYAKIAVAAIEQLAANAITALSAHINDLVAGRIEANQLYADLAALAVAQITSANIDRANINWAQINTLMTKIAEIAAAQITTANIEYANIQWAEIESLSAMVASIAQAKIDDAKITTAQISDLRAEIAKVITLAAQDGKFDFASIKDLMAQAMILEEGVAGSVYIKNLVATQANILGATLGELVLQGADGNYYNITVQSDGTISTEQVTLTDGEISAGQTSGGKQIVATTANVDALNATDIKAQSAIISSIFAGALEAGKISAQEAFLASATVPELRVTALKALGDTLDISANEQIRLIVSSVAAAQSKAEDAQTAANQNAADMAEIVTNINADIANLQTQIDGSIMTWFYNVAPTTSNLPAKDWTTTDLKNVHLGDLYYDTITGYCYRWQVQNNAYSWQRITDTDVTKALADASKAQDTADAKRRVFFAQPKPPYDQGDLWVQGSNGDILRCQTAKVAGQSYAASDWVKASKYTDDTVANNALSKATANATAIEQNTQQIALRATTTDLNNMANTLRGELTVEADGIRAEVSSLGGNNLLRNSGFYFGLDGWNRAEYQVNGDWRSMAVETGANDYRANEVPNLVLSAQNETGLFGVSQNVYGLRKNTDYTISGFVASHRCNYAGIEVRNLNASTWKLSQEFDVGWGGTNLASYDRFAYTFNTGDDTDLMITLYSNRYGENAFVWWAQLKLEEGKVATAWSPHASETHTSGIEIHENQVTVKTGGSFTVDSGAVDISTQNLRVSVQRPGDPENEVISIDPDHGRIAVDELLAKNVRPYVDYAEYRLSLLGSIREFANILKQTTFGQVSLILDTDEYGVAPVRFEAVMAQNVTIASDGHLRQSPPWIFGRVNANFYVDGICWSCLTGYNPDPTQGNTAVVACMGNILLRNCCILGCYWGIRAMQNARVSWCGWTFYNDGFCGDVFALASEGADVSVYGNVPGATNTGVLVLCDAARGVTRDVVQRSSQAAATPEYRSVSLEGALGWISTKHSWTTGIAYQGYTTGKGECYACLKFDLPAMASVASATLTLRRKSGVGKGAPVDMHLYGSASAWGSKPTLGTCYVSREDAVLAGNTVTLDVTSAAQALLAGNIVQLVLYEGDGKVLNNKTYSTDYCAWDAATLDVTYTT